MKIFFLISFFFLSLSFSKSLDEWKKEAERGDLEAIKTVASVYQNGYGVEKDYKKAFNYYLKAAMRLDEFSCMQVSMMYRYGLGVEKSLKKASSWENCKAAKKLAFLKQKEEIKIEPIINLQESFSSLIDQYRDKETKGSIKQYLSRNFGLYPYKSNYFIPFTYDGVEKENRKKYEAKFQISFMKPLFYNLLGVGETLFFGYTQQSYWQIYADSAPFRETNYEPEIFALFPLNGKFHMDAFRVSLNHQSNGQKGEISRSWNRIYAEALFHAKGLLYAVKVWYRIPEREKRFPSDTGGDDNPDIESYLGYGELRISYPFGKNFITMMLRNNLKTKDNKGAIELNWSFPVKYFKNSFGYIQIFNGYGESLIDYNRNVNKIGLGFIYSR